MTRSPLTFQGGAQKSVLMFYGDVPLLRTQTLEALRDRFEQTKAKLAMVTATPEDPTGYGRVIRGDGEIARVVEQKDCSGDQRAVREINAGIYLADSRF